MAVSGDPSRRISELEELEEEEVALLRAERDRYRQALEAIAQRGDDTGDVGAIEYSIARNALANG